jgi:glucose/arabinose dehydrogenase
MTLRVILIGFTLFGLRAFGWKVTPVVTGLEFPADIVAEPGTGVLHVVEQRGAIRAWAGKKLVTKLDWKKKVAFGGECGLLSLAFHPAYEKNGRYFLNYTARVPELTTFISEFKRGEDKERVLMKFRQPYSNHNGGQLAFDKKGHLYIGIGDGGLAGDPLNAGQDPSTLLGKILRIDVDKGDPYGVPGDNPYVKGGGLKEIFAIGLRNPWRFSFDPKTEALFVADVGQNAWEEIDIVERGGNYGWSLREGNHCYRPEKNCPEKGLSPALWEYGRTEGESVTGGFVYRGKKLKELEGAYVFGDYVSGKIWALRLDEGQKKVVKHELLLASGLSISSFGLDADGEILVADHENGRVLRLER